MNPETTYIIAAFILGFPLAIMAGGVIMQMALIVAIIGLIGYSPIVGCPIALFILFRRPLRAFVEGLGIGLGIGIGRKSLE